MGYNARPYQNKAATKYHQGYYKPLHPEKYLGKVDAIVYRSGLELKFMQYLDTKDHIIKWNSEGITIVYQDTTGASHRYYPDFYYESKNPKNSKLIDRVVVEIKPYSETQPPVRPKNESVKSLSNYEYSYKTYLKNKLKWGKAVEFCEKRGLKFIIITEKHLKKANIS
jgi:hypothetical protein